jgi:hypothetical protein
MKRATEAEQFTLVRIVTARADLVAVATVAFECRARFRRQHFLVARLFGECVVAGEIVHLDIVLVHPIAGRDRLRGKADDLPEFADRLALRDRSDRHLVALGHAGACLDVGGGRTSGDRIDRDDDIVARIEAECARSGHSVLQFLNSRSVLRTVGNDNVRVIPDARKRDRESSGTYTRIGIST